MNVTLTVDEYRQRAVVASVPGEYDAVPLLPTVHISSLPFSVHPDRLVVAGALLFHQNVSGSLTFEQACSLQVATAVRRFFQPVEVHTSPVTLEPTKMVVGDGTMRVMADEVNDDTGSAARDPDVLRFRVLSEGAGFLATRDEFSVVSNATLAVDAKASLLRRLLPALGVATLFAEDLFVRRIVLPGVDPLEESRLWSGLEHLFDAVGLRLEAGTPEQLVGPAR